MLRKNAMKVIVTKTCRTGMRLTAKMVILKQSMIDMIIPMKQKQLVEGQNKVAAKDLDLVAVIWVGLSRPL